MMRNILSIVCILSIVLFASCSKGIDTDRATHENGELVTTGKGEPTPFRRRAVTSTELREHVFTLASDRVMGRMVGTEGIRLAEEYIADRFRKLGISPLPGEDDYFLDFTLYEYGYDSEKTSVVFYVQQSTKKDTGEGNPYALSTDTGSVFSGGSTRGRDTSASESDTPSSASAESIRKVEGVLGKSYKPFPFTGLGSLQSDVVFAGYGITAPEHGWDDYRDIDVRNNIVLVFRHEPNENDPDSPFAGEEFSRYAYFQTKAENAVKHGAKGMVLVTDPTHPQGYDDFRILQTFSLDPGRPESTLFRSDVVEDDFLAVHVSRQIVETVIDRYGYTLQELHSELDDGLSPSEISLPGLTASIEVSVKHTPEPVQARNVGGYVPAYRERKAGVSYGVSADVTKQAGDLHLGEQQRASWIIVSAHHDHIGSYEGAGDTIYNGADDDASGVGGVLELAEYFTYKRLLPCNLLFLSFSAEEQGLFGSKAALEQQQIPTEHIKAVINLDMIGRNPDQPVQITGKSRSMDFEAVVKEVVTPKRLSFEYQDRNIRPIGDFYPFYSRGVPFLFFFTGFHADYHQQTDHADKLDYRRMDTLVTVVVDLIEKMCNE